MQLFVVMFETYMLCVISDIRHHVLYLLLYHVGLLALLEFEINYSILYGTISNFIVTISPFTVHTPLYILHSSHYIAPSLFVTVHTPSSLLHEGLDGGPGIQYSLKNLAYYPSH